jgi:hypothetical protein
VGAIRIADDDRLEPLGEGHGEVEVVEHDLGPRSPTRGKETAVLALVAVDAAGHQMGNYGNPMDRWYRRAALVV